LSECISLIALIFSLVALVLNIITTRNNVKLYKKRQPRFNIQLINNYCLTKANERLLLFHITITNSSETKNTFSPFLFIEYYSEDNRLMKMKLTYDPDMVKRVNEEQFKFFSDNIHLSEKESISKWLIFMYSEEITNRKPIDRYIINLRDVEGNSCEISSFLMKELHENKSGEI
jgi:hypothetical protein